jgi:sugar/nucleoside kinase (ribokinase family)
MRTTSASIVYGVVGFDDLETPAGRVAGVLGGPAVYAALASRLFAPTGIVSVVGGDFSASHRKALSGIDLAGLSVDKTEKTFRWAARYRGSMDSAETLRTDLNVVGKSIPPVPEIYRKPGKFLFLGNADPRAQREFLAKIPRPSFVALDTMNYWISSAKKELLETISLADALLVNDAEARDITGEQNLVSAMEKLTSLGPKYVIVKKGEHGALLFGEKGKHFFSPSYPVRQVVDPTGAGDSFGGAFVGFLASRKKVSEPAVRQAIVWAGAVASHTVEGFGTSTLARVSRAKVGERYSEFKKLVKF